MGNVVCGQINTRKQTLINIYIQTKVLHYQNKLLKSESSTMYLIRKEMRIVIINSKTLKFKKVDVSRELKRRMARGSGTHFLSWMKYEVIEQC